MASKKELAIELYKTLVKEGIADKDMRKTFIARAQLAPLLMTPAGASTYYVNSKTEATGGEVKNYYKPASEKRVSQAVDDSKEDIPLWSLVFSENMKKGSTVTGTADQVHAFTSQDAAMKRFGKLNPANRVNCIVVEGDPAEGADVAGMKVLAQ